MSIFLQAVSLQAIKNNKRTVVQTCEVGVTLAPTNVV